MPRVICVGDPDQSLYGFRGAMPNSFPLIGEMLESNGRPLLRRGLPVNYRCDRAMIREAQRWVPGIEGFKTAWGTVGMLRYTEMMGRVNNDGTDIALPDGEDGAMRSLPIKAGSKTSYAILCRINLPLVITYYQLMMAGKKARIIGRDSLGTPLKNLVASLCGGEPSDEDYTNSISDERDARGAVCREGLMTRLSQYLRIQTAKLTEEGFEKSLEELTQKVECLEVIALKVQDNKVSSVMAEIDALFTDEPDPQAISLSTIHRAKGLEFDVVFCLRPDLLPHPLAKPNPDGSWSDEQQQEQNAQYVCVTRARHRFYYISDWPFGRKPGALAFEGPIPQFGGDYAHPEENEELFACDWGVSPSNPIVTPVPVKPPVQKTMDLKPEPVKGNFPDDGEPF